MRTLRASEVSVGDELPELVVELTPTLIVATAIATRDYEAVHHDRDIAQAQGSKDIFMNILTTNGYVSRFVTDWAGPEAILRTLSVRLGAPNYAYDSMRMTGSVIAKEGADVTVQVRGANSLGDHVTGTVELTLP